MNDIFEFIEKPHTLRTASHFRWKRVRGRPSYLGPKLWNLVPNEYKSITPLADFKAEIKTLVPENCPCTLSKTYFSANRFYLKSDSHVPKNFSQIKIFPSYVRKNTIICLFGK